MADWLTEELGSLCTKTFVVQCAHVKYFCCEVYAIPQRLSFVVVLPYKNFCWLMYAMYNHGLINSALDPCCQVYKLLLSLNRFTAY